ncbi:adenylylsulfate kinase [Kribbella flavida DSM 17836]|uniref:Adenylyl-sulfate kinase n=1 Tax=Kribbella flavida (strain DSM 17836 / JCM 10339 / NBRC 14399) TaxID=479435 RepID=D2PSQ4_KRIFD|nr:adenylyl-sulfate kinase [Kribbella flavida]ADB33192.1 adenylylsulfate kinase [Kribbella flavida DSM 17836]
MLTKPQTTAPGTQRAGTGGVTLWLTGLPSAGKSTVARAAAKVLAERGHRVEVLDGDEIRAVLGTSGFDRAARDANVRRIGWLAELLARNGVTVLVASIAPYRETREQVRGSHEHAGIPFVEVHVAASVECCVARDVKGLYARQARGEISGVTGIDDPYEPPLAPELRLLTDREHVSRSVETVIRYLTARELV